MVLSGCQKMIKNTKPDQTLEPQLTLSVSPTAEEPWTEADIEAYNSLDQVESLQVRGEIRQALDTLSRIVSNGFPNRKVFSDRAVHILVNALSDPDSTIDDDSHAIQCFIQLESSLPDSVYGPASSCWLSVMGEILARKNELRALKTTIRSQYKKIRTLVLQIEQLKAVDLELGTAPPEEQTHE